MRGRIPISRTDVNFVERPEKLVGWLDRFAEDYAKKETIVSQTRKRDAQALIDQINAIVGNKQSSVQEKVNSYRERTGLDMFQRKAQIQNELPIPQHLQEKVFSYLKNRIETFKGNISLLSLQEELLKVFAREGLQKKEIDNPSFAKIVSNMILEEKKKLPKNEDYSNLGKNYNSENSNNSDNTDFFHAMMVSK